MVLPHGAAELRDRAEDGEGGIVQWGVHGGQNHEGRLECAEPVPRRHVLSRRLAEHGDHSGIALQLTLRFADVREVFDGEVFPGAEFGERRAGSREAGAHHHPMSH